MTRITKQIAAKIADAMTEEMYQEMRSIQCKTSEQIFMVSQRSWPKIIQKGYAEHPDYFKKNNSVQLRSEKIKVNGSYPLLRMDEKQDIKALYTLYPNGMPVISNVTDDEAKVINDLMDQEVSIEKRYRKLRQDLEEVIYNLRTYARVSEMLPEALPHLPPVQKNQGLSIDIGDIRNRLNQY